MNDVICSIWKKTGQLEKYLNELTNLLRENAVRFRKGLLIELELWWSFWNDDIRFVMLNFDSKNAP